MRDLLAHLCSLLDDATARLPGVTRRRAFGSVGYYVDDKMFALAYGRDDRLGVKLPEPAAYAALMAEPGATVWAPHGSPMSGWVLAPDAFLDDADALRPWVHRAHALVRAAPRDAGKGRPRAAAPGGGRAGAAPATSKPSARAAAKVPTKAKAPAKAVAPTKAKAPAKAVAPAKAKAAASAKAPAKTKSPAKAKPAAPARARARG